MATSALPPSLDLPPHLSAHKYFLVCTLTVAAWDTLVLSPRNWRLLRTPGWPALKILFHFLRFFMPAEFIVVAVAFFDTKWTTSMCEKFFLFEPICTAFLIAAASAVHVIRIKAIYDNDRKILGIMSALFGVQVVVTAICCGFYRSVPLREGQGCISGPKETWVGIYWVAPTLLYTVSFALALKRSIASLKDRPLSPWKLMLRDGLNLYAAIWIVNMVNVIFWFVMKPTGPSDPVKTIVTSMAAVLTTSMTLRIILNIRSSLEYGGAFNSHSSGHNTSRSNAAGGIHGLSNVSNTHPAQSHVPAHSLQLRSGHAPANAYINNGKGEAHWDGETEDKSSVGTDSKRDGVKVAIDSDVLGYNKQ